MNSLLDIKNTDAIFFDFDGVILESANIKTAAFYNLYLPYGEDIAEKAKQYHIAEQGTDRYKKFKHINNTYLNKKYCKQQEKLLDENFSKNIEEKIIKSPFIKGVVDFLELLQRIKIATYVLSATPYAELLAICKNRGIIKYFKGIYGSPKTKIQLGEDIISLNNYSRDKIVFFGDSENDFYSAESLNVNFIGISNNEQGHRFREDVVTIKNFHELKIDE